MFNNVSVMIWGMVIGLCLFPILRSYTIRLEIWKGFMMLLIDWKLLKPDGEGRYNTISWTQGLKSLKDAFLSP